MRGERETEARGERESKRYKQTLIKKKEIKKRHLTSTEVFKWYHHHHSMIIIAIVPPLSSPSHSDPIILITSLSDPITDLVSLYQPHLILPHLTSSLILNHHNFISHLNWPRPPNVSLGVYNIKYCIYIHPRSHVLTRKYDMIEELRIEYHFIYFYF